MLKYVQIVGNCLTTPTARRITEWAKELVMKPELEQVFAYWGKDYDAVRDSSPLARNLLRLRPALMQEFSLLEDQCVCETGWRKLLESFNPRRFAKNLAECGVDLQAFATAVNGHIYDAKLVVIHDKKDARAWFIFQEGKNDGRDCISIRLMLQAAAEAMDLPSSDGRV